MMFGGEDDFGVDEKRYSLRAELAVLLVPALIGIVGLLAAVLWRG